MSIYDDIVQQASVSEMLAYYGIEKNNKGQYLCPFHNDTNPSLTVTQDDKHWQCWSCGAKGNVIKLVQEIEKQRGSELGNDDKFLERYDFIIKALNLNIDFTLNSEKNVKLSPEQRRVNRLYKILDDAKQVAKSTLSVDKDNHGIATRYLASRGISADTIDYFDIGYDGNGEIQNKLKTKYNNDELYNLGIVGKSSSNNQFYDFQYGRVIIPIKDKNGKTVAFGGRSLDAKPDVKYKNTKTTELFHKSETLFNFDKAKQQAQKTNELIIVEGYFDVVSAHELKIDNVVAAMGVEITDNHIDLLGEVNNGNCSITLAFDNDNAGRNAMYKNIIKLLSSGYEVNVLDTSLLNKGKDMNDFLCNGVKKEEIKNVKISAIEFIFKYNFSLYLKNNENQITVEIVNQVYNTIFQNAILNNTLNEQKFIEYVNNVYGMSDEKINSIIHPTPVNPLLNSAMKAVFYNTIKNKVIKYAMPYPNDPEQTGDIVLSYFAQQNRININHIMQGFSNPQYIYSKNGQIKIDIVKWANEYLKNTNEYIEFEKNFNIHFYELLENVYGLDKSGKMIKIKLNAVQKDKMLNQFNNSFDNDTKEFFKNENDRFIKLYIADSPEEFEAMLGKDYDEDIKNEEMSKFRSGKMSFINYGAKFDVTKMEELNRDNPMEYTTSNGDKFQDVLVFNNSDGGLNLQQENYVIENDDVIRQIMKENAAYSFNRGMQQERTINSRENVKRHNKFSDAPTQPTD